MSLASAGTSTAAHTSGAITGSSPMESRCRCLPSWRSWGDEHATRGADANASGGGGGASGDRRSSGRSTELHTRLRELDPRLLPGGHSLVRSRGRSLLFPLDAALHAASDEDELHL